METENAGWMETRGHLWTGKVRNCSGSTPRLLCENLHFTREAWKLLSFNCTRHTCEMSKSEWSMSFS
jgi:hypothetical protein